MPGLLLVAQMLQEGRWAMERVNGRLNPMEKEIAGCFYAQEEWRHNRPHLNGHSGEDPLVLLCTVSKGRPRASGLKLYRGRSKLETSRNLLTASALKQ